MAAGDTQITLVGNLTNDPELRFTPSGAAVAKFTVASTPRYMDRQTNEWKDGDTLFLNCQIWRQAAENVAESLTRGMRVIVSGRLKQRSYETKEGEKRTVFEVEVDEVGPSLRNATAKVTYIDYKDVATLRKYISDRGKIRARRVTGACTQHQRQIADAVKNSREVALLPYTSTAR